VRNVCGNWALGGILIAGVASASSFVDKKDFKASLVLPANLKVAAKENYFEIQGGKKISNKTELKTRESHCHFAYKNAAVQRAQSVKVQKNAPEEISLYSLFPTFKSTPTAPVRLKLRSPSKFNAYGKIGYFSFKTESPLEMTVTCPFAGLVIQNAEQLQKAMSDILKGSKIEFQAQVAAQK
jgi:hypothetical protein